MKSSLKSVISAALIPTVLPALAFAQMRPQVDAIEARLERDFLSHGAVVSVVYESPQSDHIRNLTDFGDSALWTGVYLAGQCMKQSIEKGRNSTTNSRVLSLMTAIENLFIVTGIPGGMARFQTELSSLSKAEIKAWEFKVSPTMEGHGYISRTSRDQYTGVMFGLGICHQISPDQTVRARAASRIVSTVRALKANQWRIPNGPTGKSTAGNVLDAAQMAWLQLASLVNPQEFSGDYDRARRDLEDSWLDYLNPTEYNNYLEYYGWNLGYLRYYTFFSFEKDPAKTKDLKGRFLSKMWAKTWDHQNTMFTFMKLGAVGRDNSKRDQRALDEAIQSLSWLLEKNRRDYPVNNSYRRDIGRKILPKTLGWLIKKAGVDKIEVQQANRPLPMNERPYEDFYWQRSPFKLDGNGNGQVGSPAVDAFFAYWLGRYHGLIN